jgi:hypothetical protein
LDKAGFVAASGAQPAPSCPIHPYRDTWVFSLLPSSGCLYSLGSPLYLLKMGLWKLTLSFT